MPLSLSLLLSVGNAPGSLASAVSELLEVAPELTPRFEIVLVDQGNCDDTSDLAADLARRYPQVTHCRPRPGQERYEALREAAQMACGEWIFLRDESGRLNLHDLPKLWQEMASHDLVVGRVPQAAPLGHRRPLRPLRPWIAPDSEGSQAWGSSETFQLVRREVLGQIAWPQPSCETLLRELTAAGFAWGEVPLRATEAIATQAAERRPLLRGWHAQSAANTTARVPISAVDRWTD